MFKANVTEKAMVIESTNEKTGAEMAFSFAGDNKLVVQYPDVLNLLTSLSEKENLEALNKLLKEQFGQWVEISVKGFGDKEEDNTGASE